MPKHLIASYAEVPEGYMQICKVAANKKERASLSHAVTDGSLEGYKLAADNLAQFGPVFVDPIAAKAFLEKSKKPTFPPISEDALNGALNGMLEVMTGSMTGSTVQHQLARIADSLETDRGAGNAIARIHSVLEDICNILQSIDGVLRNSAITDGR